MLRWDPRQFLSAYEAAVYRINRDCERLLHSRVEYAPMPISYRDLMLATSASKPFSNPAWIFEPKYDGYRVMACKDSHQTRLITRNGIDLAGYFLEIVADWCPFPTASLMANS